MEIVMHKGEIICIDGDARGLEITNCSGTLWITQSGDPNDYLLTPGDLFTVSMTGRVAITACKTAQAHLSSPVSIKGSDSLWQAHLQTA